MKSILGTSIPNLKWLPFVVALVVEFSAQSSSRRRGDCPHPGVPHRVLECRCGSSSAGMSRSAVHSASTRVQTTNNPCGAPSSSVEDAWPVSRFCCPTPAGREICEIPRDPRHRWERRTCGRTGSNNSTGLPDGSSIRICLPPTPVTMSLRKWVAASRRARTMSARSVTSRVNRFQPPGRGRVPSGMLCPPPPAPPGALNSRRRSPRESIAKVGAGCMSRSKPQPCAVEVDRGFDIVHDVPDAHGGHESSTPDVGFNNTDAPWVRVGVIQRGRGGRGGRRGLPGSADAA